MSCISGFCGPDDATTTTEPSETTAAETTTGMTSTSGGQGACAPADGTPNFDCANVDLTRPYCNLEGVCVGCSGLEECPSQWRPACDPESDLCVQCIEDMVVACEGLTPACDPEAKKCVPCRAHEECGLGACDIFIGECFGQAKQRWVDSTSGECSPHGGTPEQPHCDLAVAVAQALASENGDLVIRARGGPYSGMITIPAQRRVAILSDQPDIHQPIVLSGSGGALAKAVVTVEPKGKAMIDGLALEDNPMGSGVKVDKGKLWLKRARVARNSGYALHAIDTELIGDSLIFTENQLGGLRTADAGQFQLFNAFITHNGNPEVQSAALTIAEGTAGEVVFSTIINNVSSFATWPSLFCEGPVNKLEIRGSILVGFANSSIYCPGAVWSHALVDAAAVEGVSVLKVAPEDLPNILEPYEDGIYRALPGGPLGGGTDPYFYDPVVDFEGDPRPDEISEDYIGADLPLGF